LAGTTAAIKYTMKVTPTSVGIKVKSLLTKNLFSSANSCPPNYRA